MTVGAFRPAIPILGDAGRSLSDSPMYLLATTDQTPNSPPPALECLAAGVSPSEDEGKVRVQLVFENGSVLPIEMSRAAGDALTYGLANELGTQTDQPK